MSSIIYQIVALCLLQSFSPGKGLTFEKEKIRIDVSDEKCTLTGDYFFKNSSLDSISQQLFYPFVVDSSLTFPHIINVTDMHENKTIQLKTFPDGIYFNVNIAAFNTKVIRVKYQQQCTANRFEYILSTTSNWQTPLKRAEFLISIPVKFQLEFMSIPADSVFRNSYANIYYFKKLDLMPKHNLIIRWSEKNEK